MTISKRNGKYYCRFQIDGERHHYLCSGATSISEAKKIEDGFKYRLQQQQNGVAPREEKNVKFESLCNLFEKYSENNKRSYQTDVYSLKILREYFGNVYIKDITPKKLEQFKTYLLEDRGVANSTVNRYRATLSKMFNLGIENKLATENPVKFIKKLQEKNYKIRFLTIDEEKRLFTEIEKGYEVVGRDRQQKIIYPYLHLKPLIITALQTGMRRGELFGLKWSNIDFDYGFIELLETKSGRSRKIPISEKLAEVLENLDKSYDYVFINPETKEPYTDIKHSFTSVLEKANITNFRFHDLRHTVATRLVESGIDLAVVKEILGHAEISTTMRYAHPVPKRKLEAISALNSYN